MAAKFERAIEARVTLGWENKFVNFSKVDKLKLSTFLPSIGGIATGERLL